MHLTGKYNVAELSFNSIFLVSVLLILQVESYFYLCYNNFIFFTKSLKLQITQKANNTLFLYSSSSFQFSFLLLATLVLKWDSNMATNIIFYIVLFLFLLNRFLGKFLNFSLSTNNVFCVVLPAFGIFLCTVMWVKSMLTFFFFLELYSVLYYFCFLTSYNFTFNTLLKYKNGVLFLLWNNFLTSIFLVIGSFLLMRNFGTCDFTELNIIGSFYPGLYLFLVGLFWKVGLPIFHFLKLEVYKQLLKENVFLFSIITTLVNVFLVLVLISTPVVFNTLVTNNYIILTIVFALLLNLVNLQLTNILTFFALSSVFTITTILVVVLI